MCQQGTVTVEDVPKKSIPKCICTNNYPSLDHCAVLSIESFQSRRQ